MTPDVTPRATPEQYQRIVVPPDGRMLSWDEVEDSDGLEGRPLRVVFNGRVMEFVEPDGVDAVAIAARRRRELHNAGRDVTHKPAGNYDPLFPLASGVEAMSEQHRAFAEHKYARYIGIGTVFFRCIGSVSDYLARRDRGADSTA